MRTEHKPDLSKLTIKEEIAHNKKMRKENYYEQFGKKGETLEIFDNEIVELRDKLKHFENRRKEFLDDFVKDNSNYVIGQQLSDTVKIIDVAWSDSSSQIVLIIFNDHYGNNHTILESEVEQYLKQLL